MNKITDADIAILRKASSVIRAINHPLRRKIVEYIASRGESSVTALYVHLRIEQSVTSQHLAILRNAGFVTTRRDGKSILYSFNETRYTFIKTLVMAIAN